MSSYVKGNGLNFKFHPITFQQEYRPTAEDVRRLRVLRDVHSLHNNDQSLERFTENKSTYIKDFYKKCLNNSTSHPQTLLLNSPMGKHWQCSCFGPIMLNASLKLQDYISELQKDEILIPTKHYENIFDASLKEKFLSGTLFYHWRPLQWTENHRIQEELCSFLLLADDSIALLTNEEFAACSLKKMAILSYMFDTRVKSAAQTFYLLNRLLYYAKMHQMVESCLWDREELVSLQSLFALWHNPQKQELVSKIYHPSPSVVVYVMSSDALMMDGFQPSAKRNGIDAEMCKLLSVHLWKECLPPVVAFLPDTPQHRSVSWLTECVFEGNHAASDDDKELSDIVLNEVVNQVVGRNGSPVRHILLIVNTLTAGEKICFAQKVLQHLWSAWKNHTIHDVLVLPLALSPELLSLEKGKPVVFSRLRFSLLLPFTFTEFFIHKSSGVADNSVAFSSLWNHTTHLFCRGSALQCTHIVAFVILYYHSWQRHLSAGEANFTLLVDGCRNVVSHFHDQVVFRGVASSRATTELMIRRALRLLSLKESVTLPDVEQSASFVEMASLAQPIHFHLSLVAALAQCFVIMKEFDFKHPGLYVLGWSDLASSKDTAAILSLASNKIKQLGKPFKRLVGILSSADVQQSLVDGYSLRYLPECTQFADERILYSALECWQKLFPSEICQTDAERPTTYNCYGPPMEVNLRKKDAYCMLVCLSRLHCPQLEAYILYGNHLLAKAATSLPVCINEDHLQEAQDMMMDRFQNEKVLYGRLTTDPRWLQGFVHLLRSENIINEQPFNLLHQIEPLKILQKMFCEYFIA